MAHTKIVFLVLPKIHLLDLAGPVQVFLEAKDYGADLSMEYCSLGENVLTSSEFPLGTLKHFSKITLAHGDYLIVPGADVAFLNSKKMAGEKVLIAWVKEAHSNGVNVCSVCTGAFFLGLTGILNGRKCTTHWKRTAELKRKFPSINLTEDVLFTEDGTIFTSAGVTAGIDLALFIVAKLTNDNISFKVARELVVYVRRAGSDPQQSVFMKYRNHIHSGVHKVQDYLQENTNQKLSLAQLADVALMSTRNLTRTFRKETGISVNNYMTLVRQVRLRELMKNRDMSRKQMAKACGLKSERQVIRLLKATA
jgi:transcriptional regulator GlxA family with amidase domain